jgi:hypothetical protein
MKYNVKIFQGGEDDWALLLDKDLPSLDSKEIEIKISGLYKVVITNIASGKKTIHEKLIKVSK